jgi:hypothetical protein
MNSDLLAQFENGTLTVPAHDVRVRELERLVDAGILAPTDTAVPPHGSPNVLTDVTYAIIPEELRDERD